MKIPVVCAALLLGCGGSTAHIGGDANADGTVGGGVDGNSDALLDAFVPLDAPADAGQTTCTQPHQRCTGPWCLVAPHATTGDFTAVYAPPGADDAWAYDATNANFFHMDSCGWNRLDLPLVDVNPVLATYDLRWNGSAFTTIELDTPKFSFGPTDTWTGCTHYDGVASTDYHCSPKTISGAATNDVWFGGLNGALWHWDGTNVTGHDSPTAATFTRIIAFSSTNVWMTTGQDSYVWDGTTFTHSGSPGLPTAPSTVTDLWFENSHWDGTSWTTMSICPDARATAAAFNSTSSGWCVGQKGLVRRLVGSTWVDYFPSDLATQPNIDVFYAYNATTQLSSEVGKAVLLLGDGNIDGPWSAGDVVPYPLKHFAPYLPFTTTVFTAGGGETWTLGVESNPEYPPVWTLMHQKAGVWSVVRQIEWSQPTPMLTDIKGSGPDDVWIAFNSQLLHWDGTNVSVAQSGTFRALWSPGPNKIWALSASLYVFDGTSWAITAAPMGNGGANSLWGTSTTNVWAVDGTTFAHWNGSQWLYAAHTDYPSANQVWGTAANDVFFIDTNSIGHYDGTSFTKLSDVPRTPPSPQLLPQISFNSGDPSTRQLWITRSLPPGILRFTAP